MSEECKKAKLRALRILTGMDKTEADLRAGLERAGFSVDAVQEAMDYVKSYGYIDDQKYAEKYVEYNKCRKSRKKIQYELMKKGVQRDLIDLALSNCEDFDEIALVRAALFKKWKKNEKPDEKELNKLFASLSRQGFSSHDIWKVLKEENLTY
jgi:regulatory protein